MFTEQRKIKGDRPIEPENDEEQKQEAWPRIQTVRRLIERDRPGAGTLTLADYVAAGYDSLGSIAAASHRVREQGTRDWSAVPGGRSWDKIEDWMTAMARSAAGPGRGGVEGLIQATLTYWELDENSAEYNQIQAKAGELMAQYTSRRQPASQRGEEARAQLQHGLITYDVPVSVVLHVTDDTLGNPVGLGRTDWFSVSAAENFARSKSGAAPAPQRFLVYDENEAFVSAWQSGRKMPMFVVAAKRAREADVTGEQWLDSRVEAQAKRRASMSARARRMAAAAHRASRRSKEASQQMSSFGEEKKSLVREQVALDVERGDLVDFGPYGQRYVADPDLRTDWWWITSDESQRFNRRAPGHSIKPFDAERIIQKWDDEMLPFEVEDYEGYFESARRPVTEGARGPVEGEVVWLSGSGQETTIQEIDWPNEKIVLAGAGGQQVVPVASLRYFGSSGIDWMCDAEGSDTETEEGVRRYRIMAGDRELMATPAHSLEQATEIAGETLAKGDRAAYIAWQDKGRVEEAGDPTLEEAFAWAGSLAAGAATGRVDAVQTDPGLSALIETLDQEVGESEG